MKLLLPLVFALLLVAPSAQAAWWFSADEPPTVRVAQSRVGDAARFETNATTTMTFISEGEIRERTEKTNQTHVTAIEGDSSAEDKYGIVRDTFAYRHDALNASGLYASERCHVLTGGSETVRIDRLLDVGGSMSSYSNGLGPLDLGSGRSEAKSTSGTSFGSATCFGSTGLAGRVFVEGDRLTFGDIMPWTPPDLAFKESAPGKLESFQGRAALRFTFNLADLDADLENATRWLVLADGLGVVAEMGYYYSEDEQATTKLVGFLAGTGPHAPADAGARLPERDPQGKFALYDSLMFDDSAFGLKFPFAEAFAWAIGKPKSELKPWLDAHPDAWLEMAFYDASGMSETTPATQNDGIWLLIFTDGKDVELARVERQALAVGPIRQSLVPASMWDAFISLGTSTSHRSGPTLAPDASIISTSGQVAQRAVAAGIHLESVESLSYYIANWNGRTVSGVYLSEAGSSKEDGTKRSASVDTITGGLSHFSTMEQVSHETGILNPPAEGSFDRAPASALSALAGPGIGAGLGVGAAAATGIALLVVGVKFLLFPLFTRLRRASLLDNPTRSRLYERIRVEPGIHQAELVDYAGLARAVTTRHLDQLQRHGFIVALAGDGRTCYYAAGEVPPDLARREAALRSGSRRAVYDLYANRPTISLREAARELGLSAPSVHRAKKQLETAGLLPARADEPQPIIARAEGARP